MLDIRRREFIALVGGGGLLLTVKVKRAWGQQPAKIPRIGILDDTPMWQAFRQALRELGYVEGQNIVYEYRYGEGAPDRLATVAAELVRRPVDLIATYGTPATFAAKEATATIPIVMIGVGDPVRAGLVPSLARPGGNITGNTVLSPDLGPKRLQILREVIAKVTRVIYLANPDNASNMAALAETKIAASEAGTVLVPVEVRVVGDFDPAFAAIMRERPDAILVSNDPFHQLHIGRIIEFLAKNRLPAMFQSKESVAPGGFIAYGPNLPDLFRRAAGYVHRILQGTKPEDLPVELPTKFDLAVNLKTAKALGLKARALIFRGAPGGGTDAQSSLDQALTTARSQQARSLELRAAKDLAALWVGQGRRDEALAFLAPIHAWFTEGFGTEDLKEAKVLLDQLQS
jgi:putative tryptophan/tyrosine transport system substrate-binding protein